MMVLGAKLCTCRGGQTSPASSGPSPESPAQQTLKKQRELLLTLCQLVLSADNLCKQFGPDQNRQNVGPDLDPNCLRLK